MARSSFIPRRTCVLAALLCLCGHAIASGPRYVTGPPFFTGGQGNPIGWKQSLLLYSIDPGDLSPTVSHSAADALVAAAANIWNVPVASITVAQGPALAEHVSSQNVYLDASGVVFPDDVSSNNFAAVPLAVIYDSDGSVTETLLGAGSSDPSSCRENSVTESVDRFDPAGFILHALIIVNGRCTGPAPEMQLELRYKLQRAFGRVLGLAWSQTNDNVFTGNPQPTNAQQAHWPIMHPIDLICGPYSFQCLPNPFTLRPDDVASMVAVYPIADGAANLPPGKQPSLSHANGAFGTVKFPTGQGMAGVNVLVRRELSSNGVDDGWFEASAVTGTRYRRASVAPFAPSDPSPSGSFGTGDPGALGNFSVAYMPIDEAIGFDNLIISTEPVNPLYTGSYSLGPYAAGVVLPSGSRPNPQTTRIASQGGAAGADFVIGDAAASCGDHNDGTILSPIDVPPSGWWNGIICGVGHASYLRETLHPNRTFTVEVTALDSSGMPDTTKLMPVIGLFAPGDGGSPSLGFTPAAFQGNGLGMTTLTGETTSLSEVEIGIADQRGDGRPDFPFSARLFLADALVPEHLGTGGGTLTINGMGFRTGNAVSINGVTVRVVSSTATQIVVEAPSMAGVSAMDHAAVDVRVWDRGSGANSIMQGALTYDSSPRLPNTMRIVSAPSGILNVGETSATPFSVQVLQSDVLSPVVNEHVVFSMSGASARFSVCGAGSCIVLTDSGGFASTSVTALAAGDISATASDGALAKAAIFHAQSDAATMTVLQAPSGNVKVGEVSGSPFTVRLLAADGSGLPGRSVTFSVVSGSALFSGCNLSTCTVTTDWSGAASIQVTPTAVGTLTLKAAGGAVSQQIALSAVDNTDILQVVQTPAATSFVNESAGNFSIRLLEHDGTSPVRYSIVTFSAPDGVLLLPCGTPVCAVPTNTSGGAGVSVSATRAGIFPMQVAFGSLSQSVTVTASERTMSLSVVETPENNIANGARSQRPFSVRLLGLNGEPMAGTPIVLAGPTESVLISACNLPSCLVTTDGNGIASSTLSVFGSGTIVLSATYLNLTTTTTVSGVGSETLHLVSSPGPAGVLTGDTQSFAVELVSPDGSTPLSGQRTTFAVVGGAFSLPYCVYQLCGVTTDPQGLASISGVGFTPGDVEIDFTDGTVSQTFRFTVHARGDVMRLLSPPTGGTFVGDTQPAPFSVQLFEPDGITPAPGRPVLFTASGGTFTFTGCSSLGACLVRTDAQGIAAVGVLPATIGTFALLATEGTATQTATLFALPKTNVLHLLSAPSANTFAGEEASTPLTLAVVAADGLTPIANESVTISVASGTVRLRACAASTCILVSDTQGIVSTAVTPLAPGSISLVASDRAATLSANFNAISKPDAMRLISAPSEPITIGTVAAVPFAVQILAGDGGAGVAGRSVTFSVRHGTAASEHAEQPQPALC